MQINAPIVGSPNSPTQAISGLLKKILRRIGIFLENYHLILIIPVY